MRPTLRNKIHDERFSNAQLLPISIGTTKKTKSEHNSELTNITIITQQILYLKQPRVAIVHNTRQKYHCLRFSTVSHLPRARMKYSKEIHGMYYSLKNRN